MRLPERSDQAVHRLLQRSRLHRLAPEAAIQPGDANRGRALFNGIGGCFNCHGYDGVLSRRPKVSPQLAEEVARLTPPPADLRDQARLKAETEQDRLRSIKFGHPGTAMFPKKFLMKQELADLLAYLATLRAEGRRGSAER
ncbi:MAG: c-type cytochrome [Nitrospiraceae bacterium]